jgi:hypothetical protein
MGDFVQNGEVEAICLEIFDAFELLREAYRDLAVRLDLHDVHVDWLLVYALGHGFSVFLFGCLDPLDDGLGQRFHWTSYEPDLLGYCFPRCCKSCLEAEGLSPRAFLFELRALAVGVI